MPGGSCEIGIMIVNEKYSTSHSIKNMWLYLHKFRIDGAVELTPFFLLTFTIFSSRKTGAYYVLLVWLLALVWLFGGPTIGLCERRRVERYVV